MLEIRPIVVNKDMVVLGGNMRLRACKEAGIKKVPVIFADDLNEEQQREFIIKDNVGFGEWDWAMLANEWDYKELDDWGLTLPNFDVDKNNDNYDEAREHFGLGFIQKNNGENVVAKERIITYEQYINRNSK